MSSVTRIDNKKELTSVTNNVIVVVIFISIDVNQRILSIENRFTARCPQIVVCTKRFVLRTRYLPLYYTT